MYRLGAKEGLLAFIKNHYSIYFFNRVWLDTYSRNPLIDYIRLAFLSARAVAGPLPKSRREEFRAADRIALSSSGNQDRAIRNFESSALILSIFSLSRNDAAVFRYEFFRVFLGLLISAPLFAILSTLHVFFLNRNPFFYAVGCVLLGGCLTFGFQRRNVDLDKKTHIIFGNDHFFLLRGIIQAWQKKHNLVYVQHGLIGPSFPNPNCFDEIYLDGRYSINRYDFDISQEKLRQSPQSRFSEEKKTLKPIPKKNSEVRIGLAFQDPEYAKHFISKNLHIIQSFRSLSIRLHPRLGGGKFLTDMYSDLDVHIGSEWQLAEFFQETDLLISEASSLLIDSMVFGTPCIQLDAGPLGDYYGLAEEAIVPSTEDHDLNVILNIARSFDFAHGFSQFGLRL